MENSEKKEKDSVEKFNTHDKASDAYTIKGITLVPALTTLITSVLKPPADTLGEELQNSLKRRISATRKESPKEHRGSIV